MFKRHGAFEAEFGCGPLKSGDGDGVIERIVQPAQMSGLRRDDQVGPDQPQVVTLARAEGVGQKAVAAEAVGAEAVFEFFDAVLALAAVVVESEDFGGRSGTAGHDEAQVGSGGGVFGLVADAAPMRPTAGTVAEAGEAALGKLGAAIAAL